jgi:hypothetical protein
MFSSGSRIEDSALRYSLIGIEPKQADGCGSHRGKWLRFDSRAIRSDPAGASFGDDHKVFKLQEVFEIEGVSQKKNTAETSLIS